MKECKYDVRGEIYLAAVKRTNEGKEVIYTNVGNPQALGQVSTILIKLLIIDEVDNAMNRFLSLSIGK